MDSGLWPELMYLHAEPRLQSNFLISSLLPYTIASLQEKISVKVSKIMFSSPLALSHALPRARVTTRDIFDSDKEADVTE